MAATTNYVETSRSKPQRRGQHEIVTTIIGVATSDNDTYAPVVGKLIPAAGQAPAVPTDPLAPICQDVATDPTSHAGRVFFTASFVALMGV